MSHGPGIGLHRRGELPAPLRLLPQPPLFHDHLCVVDGLIERVECEAGPELSDPTPHLRFHEATALSHELLKDLQHTVRKRVLRHLIELSFASFDGLAGHLMRARRAVIRRAARLRRHGLLEPHHAEDMLTWDHGGGLLAFGS